MFVFVKIRYQQLKYELKQLGILHSLFLGVLYLGFETLLYLAFSEYPLYATAAVFVVVLGQHLSRKDANFIKINIEKPEFALFFDYLSCVLVFTIPVLFTVHWYAFFLILIGIGGVSCIKTKQIHQPLGLRFLSRFIPASMFEALSGGRRNYLIIALLILYFSALAVSWVRGLPLFLL